MSTEHDIEQTSIGCCRIRCRTHWRRIHRRPGPVGWSLEGEWGLALKDGATGIPYAGLSSYGTAPARCLDRLLSDSLSDAGHDLTLGWRLLSAPGDLDTELDVKALRRRDGEGKTNHGIGAQWKLRW